METVLILGASGLVGKALSKELAKNYKVYGTYSSNQTQEAAIRFQVEEDSISEILNELKPSRIINCLRGDFQMQLKAWKEVLSYAKEADAWLYLCSTGNVFDGVFSTAHFRNEKAAAESEYGKFKIQSEDMLLNEWKNKSAIFRLPMIWGKASPRMDKLAADLKNNNKVKVYSNGYFNNNTDIMLAKQIAYAMDNDLSGVFHTGSSEVINHYEFIKAIAEKLGYRNAEYDEEILEGDKYYLAVLPEMGEWPKELEISNEEIIEHLCK
ncbi:sugar nucleotide-binding protein [Clostridium sp. 19966]|uniref:sugar nucleotide-binding protein n=1 Tax=Clostridium sp. 19966 TaxID=2768166 RepID=UPI0028DE067F|nr:sugar nucleotide-binding protein [Clostridium sp. 19966]MDT8718348.1 sugar nucleotide-binding protein [Clostridium sp. 19966]